MNGPLGTHLVHMAYDESKRPAPADTGPGMADYEGVDMTEASKTEPRIVTQEEARETSERLAAAYAHIDAEPDRTRAAVVKAFRAYAQYWRERAQISSTMTGRHVADTHADVLDIGATAIENGADF